MGAGLTIVLIVLIICVAILFGLYMGLSAETNANMFANPDQEKRIKNLEKAVEELRREE